MKWRPHSRPYDNIDGDQHLPWDGDNWYMGRDEGFRDGTGRQPRSSPKPPPKKPPKDVAKLLARYL